MEYIDTHCHLDEDAFEPDRDDVVARAAAAGVVRVIPIGTTAHTSHRAVEVAGRYPGVFAAVGIQPNYVHEVKAGDWETVVSLLERPGVVAIGETGLDRYWDYAPSFGRGPFRNVTCLSVNDAVLHGLPHDYVLRDGDILSMDLAVGIDG